MGRPDHFQKQFGNHGGVDFAAGSVFGARWWNLAVNEPFLQGVYAQWTPGVNTAECLVDETLMLGVAGGATVTLPRAAASDLRAVLGAAVAQLTPSHTAPEHLCTCGFYGYWSPTADDRGILPSTPMAAHVFGVVEGFGRTLLGDRGFRCEKVRIVAAYVEPRDEKWREWDDTWSTMPNIPTAEAAGEVIKAVYRVPVYSTREELLAKHPTGTAPPVVTP